MIAISIGDDHGERVARRVAGRVGGQLVRISDRSVGEPGHRQGAVLARHHIAHCRNGGSVDGDDRRTIGGRVSDGSARELAVAGSRRAGGRAREAVLVHFGSGLTGDGDAQGGPAVGKLDSESCGVRAAVTVGQGVGKLVGRSACTIRIPNISIAAVCVQGEAAVVACNDHRPRSGTHAGRAVRYRGNGCVVGADQVGARRATGRARAGNDVPALGRGSGGESVGVVGRNRSIVDHVDGQRGRCFIAIAIDDGHLEETVARLIEQVVRQQVGETDLAAGEIDADDGHRAHRRGEGLPGVIDGHAVDQDCRGPVRSIENDRAAGGLTRVAIVAAVAVGGFAGTGRFAVPHGKPGFVNGRDGGHGADRVVGRFDDHAGFAIDEAGNDFRVRLRAELQFGVGQQVAEIVSGLDSPFIGGEVAARAQRRPRGGLHFAVDQQGGDVGRRDDGAVHDNLGYDDRAVRDEDLLAVVEHNQKIAAIGLERNDVYACRKGNDIAGAGNDDLRAFRTHGDMGLRVLVSGRRFASSSVADLVAHAIPPQFRHTGHKQGSSASRIPDL